MEKLSEDQRYRLTILPPTPRFMTMLIPVFWIAVLLIGLHEVDQNHSDSNSLFLCYLPSVRVAAIPLISLWMVWIRYLY